MINALIAVCQDPKSFYGHDLVAMLEHLDTSHPFEYTYVMMTLCNAGIHVRKKQVKRLYSFVDSEEGHNHGKSTTRFSIRPSDVNKISFLGTLAVDPK